MVALCEKCFGDYKLSRLISFVTSYTEHIFEELAFEESVEKYFRCPKVHMTHCHKKVPKSQLPERILLTNSALDHTFEESVEKYFRCPKVQYVHTGCFKLRYFLKYLHQ